MAPPFSLSDRQLAELMQVAEPLDPSKRLVLVERVAAALRLNGNGHPTNDEVEACPGSGHARVAARRRLNSAGSVARAGADAFSSAQGYSTKAEP